LDIIEHIWSNTLELRKERELPPLAAVLNSLLAVPMICFTTRTGVPEAHAFVSYACDEVLPGVSLADVLFEEFEIEICDQTIVLVQPISTSDADPISSEDLGQALGQVLVELAGMKQDEIQVINAVTEADFKHQVSRRAERHILANLGQ
jgi:hypothetical protein